MVRLKNIIQALPIPESSTGKYQWNKEEISWRDAVTKIRRIRASHPVEIDEGKYEWRRRRASVSGDLRRTLHVQLVQLCLQRFEAKVVELWNAKIFITNSYKSLLICHMVTTLRWVNMNHTELKELLWNRDENTKLYISNT